MKRIILLFSLLAVLYSCETDFEVNAPYKEVIVIDGLLNAIDDTQSVRVSKAYLGEGNSLVMAQVSDSINFGNILDVYMERIKLGSVQETIHLDRSEFSDKEPGIFSNKYVLYQTAHPILQDGSEYKLIVTDKQTGITATSQTKIVNNMALSNIPGSSNGDSIDFATGANNLFLIRFTPGANAYYYEMIIRFNYREIDPAGNSILKSVDWYFPVESRTSGNEKIFSFYKYSFFDNLGAKIPDLPGYTRRVDTLDPGKREIEFFIMEGSEDLNTYVNLQKPAEGVVQDKPLFTTVNNGLGLFSSRLIRIEPRFMMEVMKAAFDTSAAVSSKNFKFN